jgi:hypothetical protein
MRRLKTLVIVIMLQCVLAGAQTVALSIQPAAQRIAIDSSGKVRVAIDSVKALHAYSIRVHYDPVILRYRSFQGLQFLGTSSFLFKQVDSVNGFVQIDEALLGPGGRSGSGNLFEMTFVASSNGTAKLQFTDADLRDSTNTMIPAGMLDADIQVGNVSGVEETKRERLEAVQVVNYPNPFNLSTTIVVRGEVRTHATLQIFSSIGQEVFRTNIAPGQGEGMIVTWNARDYSGKVVPSGMYLLRVEANASVYWTKTLLVK